MKIAVDIKKSLMGDEIDELDNVLNKHHENEDMNYVKDEL